MALPPAASSDDSEDSGAPLSGTEGMQPAPMVPASGNAQLIAAHIERHLGPISGVYHEEVSDQVPLEVYFVAPSAEFPFYALVTAGMSDQPMRTPPETSPEQAPPYAELCLLLPSTWPLPTDPAAMQQAFRDEATYWPIRWLLRLARLPHAHHTWLGFGHTVPNGAAAAPFAANTRLGCLLLLTAISLPEEFQTLEISPAKTIQFYTLYPLYPEEMALKMALGVDALLDRFEEHDSSDVLDLARPNVALT